MVEGMQRESRCSTPCERNQRDDVQVEQTAVDPSLWLRESRYIPPTPTTPRTIRRRVTTRHAAMHNRLCNQRDEMHNRRDEMHNRRDEMHNRRDEMQVEQTGMIHLFGCEQAMRTALFETKSGVGSPGRIVSAAPPPSAASPRRIRSDRLRTYGAMRSSGA